MHGAHGEAKAGLFHRLMTPFLIGDGAKRARRKLWLVVLLLVGAATAMPVVQWVVLKMLPFDNKSEFQLVLDMPEGATLEQTERTLLAVGRELAKVPEVKDYQIYAGTAAPSISTAWCATTLSAAAPTWGYSGQSGGQA